MKRAPIVLTLFALVATLLVPAVNAQAQAVRPVQRVHVNAQRQVVAPASIRPGLVHLRNTGRRAVLIVKKKQWGVSTVVKDYNSSTPVGWQKHFVTIDRLWWHRDAYTRLAKGTYFLVDASLTMITEARVTTMTVGGNVWNASKPMPSSAITISGRHNSIVAPAKMLTHSWLHLRNKTVRDQVVALYRVGNKTTDAQLIAFLANPSLAKLTQLDLHAAHELWYTSGHRGIYEHEVNRAGRYLLATLAFRVGSAKPQFGKVQAVAITVQ